MVKEIISNTQALWQYSQVKGFIVVFVVVVVMFQILPTKGVNHGKENHSKYKYYSTSS